MSRGRKSFLDYFSGTKVQFFETQFFFDARIYDYKSTKNAVVVKKAKPRIALLREKAGLTQLELSRLVGVTESTVQNWESGRTGTDHIDRIIRFCKALNCQVEELIEYVEVEGELDGKPSSLKDIHNLLGTDQPSSTESLDSQISQKSKSSRK